MEPQIHANMGVAYDPARLTINPHDTQIETPLCLVLPFPPRPEGMYFLYEPWGMAHQGRSMGGTVYEVDIRGVRLLEHNRKYYIPETARNFVSNPAVYPENLTDST